MIKSSLLKLAFLALVAIGVTACSNDDDGYYYYPENVAYGVIVNASPNSGDLFIYADANQVNNEALNYTDARGYYNFYTGDRWFVLKNQNGEVLDSLAVTLDMGEAFSVFATNTYDDISLEVFSDDVDYPGGNSANLRIINLSPDAPAVDVYLDGEMIAEGVNFGDATAFMEFDKGDHDILISDTATDETLYESADVEFYDGRTYTIYTKGYVAPPDGSNDVFSTETIVHF